MQRPEPEHEAHSNTDAPKDGNGSFKQSPDTSNNPHDCQCGSGEYKARAHVVALVQQEHQSDCILLCISLGAITVIITGCHNARHLPPVVE